MDRYLEIAREVLRSSKQPLSARQILRVAHQLQLVPRDLYGRTQQKTMQARLASDILKQRSKSQFYRTSPGRFFLRVFQNDRSIPARYRREYQAPLRAAQLGRFDVIAFPQAGLAEFAVRFPAASFPTNHLARVPWRYLRLWGLRTDTNYIPFRFHLLLFSEEGIMVDDQVPIDDGDMAHRSVLGLPGIVKRSDRSLFSADEFGLVEAASRTLLERFELPSHVLTQLDDTSRWSEARALIEKSSDGAIETEMMVFIGFRCAGLAEITDAVGSKATSGWLPFGTRPNNLDRFDRWSSRFLCDADLQAALGA